MVREKQNVLLVPPGFSRTTADGKVELKSGENAWSAAPDGVVVHEIGEMLPPELCDVVIMVGTIVEDKLGQRIIGPSGARPKTSAMIHGEIMRMPLLEWQAQYAKNLQGD
jgi:hypothetical protein